MSERSAFYAEVGSLAAGGPENIPEEFIPKCHLIYNSPATLSYNSPGAVGFGVKRAGLVIPESVMLLVSPNACGRNSSILSHEESYADRMFYLTMSESDLVNSKHLTKISDAVLEIAEICSPRPKVVLICVTCVDALLGTDLERVCRKATEETGIKVVPSYMYALTREGKKPPMVAIRQTIYSLLERKPVQPDMINLLGFFTPIDPDSDLFTLFKEAGIKKINQVSACSTLDEYAEMGAANFNLMLHPESRFAADWLQKKINMPYVEFARVYDPEKIHRQYQLFASAVGITIGDAPLYEHAIETRKNFAEKYKGTSIAIGEMCNANPYELAATLSEMGMEIPVIFSNLTAYDFPYLRRLAKTSPHTKIYAGISPSMVYFKEIKDIDLAIGKDASDYCPSAKAVGWFSEKQPFGYKGFEDLIAQMTEVLG